MAYVCPPLTICDSVHSNNISSLQFQFVSVWFLWLVISNSLHMKVVWAGGDKQVLRGAETVEHSYWVALQSDQYVSLVSRISPIVHTYIINQSYRQGKSRQLHLKTAHFFQRKTGLPQVGLQPAKSCMYMYTVWPFHTRIERTSLIYFLPIKGRRGMC